MSRREKLIISVLDNPRDVRFDDACKIAKWLGFVGRRRRRGSSHRIFARPGELTQLNFQETRNGLVKSYQADQLIAMIVKYRDEI